MKTNHYENGIRIAAELKRQAERIGFALCGIAPATPGLGEAPLTQWLNENRHGEMTYMERHRQARLDPGLVLENVKSVVVVAMAYRTKEPEPAGERQGRISRYAWGDDYHDLLREKLLQLGAVLDSEVPEASWRAVVDSAPLMERDYARLAGLGWFGKNTLLLNRRRGSFFFLGALLVDRELAYDSPHETDHCGSCTRCLDACPTNAFDGPYRLDPRRCISYLTIEHRSAIPDDLKAGMENWLFGCDVCQDVCPWNRKAPLVDDPRLRPKAAGDPVELLETLRLSDREFRDRFRKTPLFRSKRTRVLRNACIAAGNSGDPSFAPALQALTGEEEAEPLRDAARWALARLETSPPTH